MKKMVAFITSVCICVLLIGCTKKISTLSNNTFNEAKAISMVVKDHTDFPSSQYNTIIKKLPIGGPPGTIANVKFTTKAEKFSNSTYLVILTKDWGISVNGKYAKSSWKYKVTSESVTLVDSIDNDYLPNIMK